MNDPPNPELLRDSTYPDPDPVRGISPAEGNAHAAVFGGTTETGSDLIFGGDEDFDPLETLIFAATDSYAATQGSEVPQIGTGADIDSVSGPTTYVGLACDTSDVPAAPGADSVAVIGRGVCAFKVKAQLVEAMGYQAAIVMNDAPRCEASMSMLVEAGIPALFVPLPSGLEILGKIVDPATCDDATLAIGDAGQDVDIKSSFNGWGHLHVLNNNMGDVTVPLKDSDPVTVGYLGEVGYCTPVEVTDSVLATGAGDLTMHNLETDPADRRRSFISWYSAGVRAVEWRPGHLHNNAMGEGKASWNVHEVGRWIATPEEYGADAEAEYGSEPLTGSNFWRVHVKEINGTQYVLGSDRNTGLHIFAWQGEGPNPDNPALYCNQ